MIYYERKNKWCGRRLIKNLFHRDGFLGKSLKVLREAIRDNTIVVFLLWLISSLAGCAIAALSSLLYDATGEHGVFFIKIEITISVLILIYMIVGALYDIFKEEQERIITTLKNND